MKPQTTTTIRRIALAAALTGAFALVMRRPTGRADGRTGRRPGRAGDQLKDLYSTTRCDLGGQASFPLRCSSTPPSR